MALFYYGIKGEVFMNLFNGVTCENYHDRKIELRDRLIMFISNNKLTVSEVLDLFDTVMEYLPQCSVVLTEDEYKKLEQDV